MVQAGSAERVEALTRCSGPSRTRASCRTATAGDGHEAEQPVFLTSDDANPNGASVRFLVDRAMPPADGGRYDRLC